ncbi:CotH kinase family protein [Candidatus Merdisoma sp. JLR.KK006]|uniref:CotH kinase family protein n=1 Tax=Candidatus Merdisoma sp. JLR.KK006 TaxID=3112626 RepID=UPI002FEF38AB
MKMGLIPRRNLLLLSLLTAGSLFFLISSVSASYYQAHPDEPAFLLRINEVCTINPGTKTGEAFIYEDYIELYNPSDTEISLDHLYLSDTTKDYALVPLSGGIIPAGGYYVVYADGGDGSVPEGYDSLPFRLSENETITLSYCAESQNGTKNFFPIDSLFIPSLSPGIVYARTEDGMGVPKAMRPSPGASNQTASLLLESPAFSMESGFYTAPFTVQIQVPENLSVYYTLDGSEPTPDDYFYTGPLTFSDPSPNSNVFSVREDITSQTSAYASPDTPVDKALILRAAAYDESGNYSQTITASYFLDFEKKTGLENISVLSLVTDPANLFDDHSGIYVRGSRYEQGVANAEISPDLSWSKLTDYLNYYLRGTISERPAHLTLMDSSHSLLLEEECGIRIRGNESRSFPQKSFTLFARKRYGSDTFAPVFFDTGFSYPDLILNSSKELKKVFFFSLVEDRSAAVQRYTPCQVFLNGEYWGMYYLMEKYSAEYLENHYGIEKENSLLIKTAWEVQEGDPDDVSQFQYLQNYLDLDMSDPGLYEDLQELMDMQSFIDWMCTNIYIANTDSKPLGGNVFTWRASLPGWKEYEDGKWRWMLYDLDDSLGVGINSDSPAYLIDSFVDCPDYSPAGFLDDEPMPSLMRNEDFRRQFVLTFMDMANENFKPSRVLPLLDQLEAQYSNAAAKSYERWNTVPLDAPFEDQIEELRSFFANRYDAIVPYLAKHFSLTGELVPLTLSAENPEGGIITLNTLSPDLTSGSWTGSYYTDYPLTLTAEPLDGHTFLGWEVTDCQILSNSTAPTVQIQLRGGTTPSVKAIFSK